MCSTLCNKLIMLQKETAEDPVAVSADDIYYYSLHAIQFARAHTAFISGVEMSIQRLISNPSRSLGDCFIHSF